jgi:dual specificity phosphatase 12
MGKSRSATVCIAYLMQRYGITPTQALAQLRQAREICEPNEGFMAQLELYHAMCTPADVDNTPAYQRWLYQRELSLARDVRQAPDAEKIRFEDEQTGAEAGNAAFELRCRKCR